MTEPVSGVGRAIIVPMPCILGLPFLVTWIMIFDYLMEGGVLTLWKNNEYLLPAE
jgi:hypothetical protein